MNSRSRIGLIAAAGAALAISSCAPGGRSPSGFLGNYRQLDAGYGTANAVSVFVKPGVDLKRYDSVIIDPVTTVVGTPGISPDVKNQLAAYLGDSLREQSHGRLKMASVPGPSTLRVRAALTDVVEGSSPGQPVTTVHANPRVTLTGTVGENAPFIASASFEGEILDSTSGERLCALTDQRHGAKREVSPNTPWSAVRASVNQSARQLWQRFDAARGQ